MSFYGKQRTVWLNRNINLKLGHDLKSTVRMKHRTQGEGSHRTRKKHSDTRQGNIGERTSKSSNGRQNRPKTMREKVLEAW